MSFSKEDIIMREIDQVVSDGRKTVTVNTGEKVVNVGLEPDLKLRDATKFEWIFFKSPFNEDKGGTFQYSGRLFDGIACDDKHITLKLDEKKSYLRFRTPPLEDWSAENTIEFWFKLDQDRLYDGNRMLFSMTDEKNQVPYYTVFIEDGVLKCAPFGVSGVRDPVLVFDQFSLLNKDRYGWWHISCSYSFQEDTKGTLFN